MNKTKKNNETEALVKEFAKSNAYTVSEVQYKAGEGTLTVKIFPAITLADRMMMINNIVKGVFTGKGDTIDDYAPEYLWFLKKYYTVLFFTDFPLPKKVEDVSFILNRTALFDEVAGYVGEELTQIFEEVDRKIEAKKSYLANKTDINTFLSRITKSIDSIGAEIENVDMGKVIGMLQNLQKNIQPEDLVKAVAKQETAGDDNDKKNIN